MGASQKSPNFNLFCFYEYPEDFFKQSATYWYFLYYFDQNKKIIKLKEIEIAINC